MEEKEWNSAYAKLTKGDAAKVTNAHEAAPFDKQGPGFHCTLSALVELAVINCSWTRFGSDESVALRQTRAWFSLYAQCACRTGRY